MSKSIPLTRGLAATVDDDDYGWLMQWKWHAFPNQAGQMRAARSVRRIKGNGAVTWDKVFMHRVTAGALPGILVDHANHDTLDNRRDNLRVCTVAENHQNQMKHTGKYRYKGIKFHKRNRGFVAYVTANGRTYYAGCGKTQEDAARAYDAAARRLHGKFAALNFPQKGERAARMCPTPGPPGA